MKFTQHTQDLSTPPSQFDRCMETARDIAAAVVIGCLLALVATLWGLS